MRFSRKHSWPSIVLGSAACCVISICILGGAAASAADADLDTSFSSDGKIAFFMHSGDSVANAVAIQPDGKIVVVGTSHNGANTDIAVARFNSNGTLDLTFSGDGRAFYDFGWGNDTAEDVAIQIDGKIVVVGEALVDGTRYIAVVRFNANGTFDQYTTVNLAVESRGFGIALYPDGRIVLAGTCLVASSGWDFAVARLNTNLTPDTTFSGDGVFYWDFGDEGTDIAYDAAVQSDGTIVIGGSASFGSNDVFGLMMFSSTGGVVDLSIATFPNSAYGYGMTLQPDDKPVIVGMSDLGSGAFAIARFKAGGGLDTTFSGDGMDVRDFGALGYDPAQAVAVQQDGKIVVVGFATIGGYQHLTVMRYHPWGNLDFTFNPPTVDTKIQFFSTKHAYGYGVSLQPDGKILAVGCTEWEAEQPAAAVRLLGDENLIFSERFEWGSTVPWSVTVP